MDEGLSVRWRDGTNSYGWLSIVLHWATAIGIIVLLFLGDSLGQGGGRVLRLHTTVALALLPLVAFRIYWRVRRGHPGPAPRQRGSAYRVAKLLHFILLAAIATMFVSGPLTAWTGGLPIHFFDFTVVDGTVPRSITGFDRVRALHVLGAQIIVFGTLVHVTAVFKHMIFDKDGTFDRIMVPDTGKREPRHVADSSATGRSDHA